MCGIAGLVEPIGRRSPRDLTAIATAMSDAVTHRGPDGSGVWVDEHGAVALGHRRLAIIDLSPTGAQPMTSASGRWTVTFNGELYNYPELRAELGSAGRRFRGQSDTEVLIEAIDEWGLDRTLRRSNGMFALAAWDRERRTLHLARDRLGEKPLYYGRAGSAVLFASELKSLRAHPAFEPRIDRDVLALYLRLNYVPAPYCIYEGVVKLPAGSTVALEVRDEVAVGEVRPYWSLAAAAEEGLADPFTGPPEAAVEELDALLRDAVAMRMHADVPLGAFLSGGVDSSTVVALMQAQASRPVRTFTIAFGDAAFDEATEARAVAEHLGTDHTEVQLSPTDALDVIPQLPTIYDEPFADPSQLPTLLVSEVARRHVTVALSGDGGDELFAGYNRHFLSRYAWRRLGWLPSPARSGLARALLAVSPSSWDRLGSRAERVLPTRLVVRNPGDKIQKLAALLGATTPDDLYRRLVTQWDDPAGLLVGAREARSPITDPSGLPALADVTDRILFLDSAVSLPDQMLVKVDRASMAVSLEARVPLLDHRVVELSWRLPLEMKLAGDRGKWILREVLDRYVPRTLIERPKMGFDPPIGTWLRGPLREWAESLLAADRLAAQGFDPRPVRARWDEHLRERRNWTYQLWGVLMFQAWAEAWSGTSQPMAAAS